MYILKTTKKYFFYYTYIWNIIYSLSTESRKAGTLGVVIALKKIEEHEGDTTPSFTPVVFVHVQLVHSVVSAMHHPISNSIPAPDVIPFITVRRKENQIMDWKIPGANGHKYACKRLQELSK